MFSLKGHLHNIIVMRSLMWSHISFRQWLDVRFECPCVFTHHANKIISISVNNY